MRCCVLLIGCLASLVLARQVYEGDDDAEAERGRQLVFGAAFWRNVHRFSPCGLVDLNPFQLEDDSTSTRTARAINENSNCLHFTALLMVQREVNNVAHRAVEGSPHGTAQVPLWRAIHEMRRATLRGVKDERGQGGRLAPADAAKLWHIALAESLLLQMMEEHWRREGGDAASDASRSDDLPAISLYAYVTKSLKMLRADGATPADAATRKWREAAEAERERLRQRHSHLRPIFDHVDGVDGKSEPATAEASAEVQGLLALRLKLSRKTTVSSLASTAEERQKLSLAVESILTNEKVFAVDLERPRDVHALLNQLTNADRVPSRSSYEALLLLRDAYDRIDIFSAIAQRNKLRSKISYTSLLLLNLLLLTWNTVSGDVEAWASPGSDARDSSVTSLGLSGVVVLSLSIANTFAASVITLLNPIVKWKALRAAAMGLESEVFAYRTRTGPYAPPPGMLHEQADRGAERLLAERIRAASDDVFDRAAIAGTAFFGKHVMSSGGGSRQQHDPSSPASEEATVLVRRSWWSRLRPPRGSGRVADEGTTTAFGSAAAAVPTDAAEGSGADAAVLAPDAHAEQGLWPVRDDFHTPLPSSAYVRFRLRPAIDFYQKRLPVRHCYDVSAKVAMLLISATSVVLATLGYSPYVSIATGLAYYITAYVEFSEWARKVRRYSGVVKRLSNLLVWWNELSDTEKALVANVNRLVGETETTLMFAIDAWADTAAQTNSVGAAMGEKHVDKNKDKDAKGKAEGLRGAAQPELTA